MSYNKCICNKCGSLYATRIQNELEIEQETCPRCGEKQLKMAGPLSFSEMNSFFSGGG